jgi:hypothetical protein
LIAALILTSAQEWPSRRYALVAALAIAFGLSYTIFSEWLKTEIRRSWAYSDLMPTLPLIGTGLLPLAQWLLVPSTAFWLARYRLTPKRPKYGAMPKIGYPETEGAAAVSARTH